MLTPAGRECVHYYEDFARGASRQECRAVHTERSARWRPAHCAACPVPEILAANGSPYLDLALTIHPGLLGLGRRTEVRAGCSLHGVAVSDPRLGCAVCNREADELLRRALE